MILRYGRVHDWDETSIVGGWPGALHGGGSNWASGPGAATICDPSGSVSPIPIGPGGGAPHQLRTLMRTWAKLPAPRSIEGRPPTNPLEAARIAPLPSRSDAPGGPPRLQLASVSFSALIVAIRAPAAPSQTSIDAVRPGQSAWLAAAVSEGVSLPLGPAEALGEALARTLGVGVTPFPQAATRSAAARVAAMAMAAAPAVPSARSAPSLVR